MTEQWRPVLGMEGLYEVSDLGRVRGLDRLVPSTSKTGKAYVRRWRGRVLKACVHSGGYAQVGLTKSVGVRLVHALVAEAFIGPRPEGQEVCHNDGDKWNNRLDNLRYDSPAANSADRKLHGTEHTGTRNPASKLDERTVFRIRRLAKVMRQRDVAKMFGISQGHVSRLHRREQWQHV